MHKLLNQVFCISILYFSLIPTGLNAGYVDKINNNSSFSDSLNLNLLTNEQFDQFVNKKISSMSLKDKIGQLFILGFHGTKFTGKLKKRINKFNPGSVIVYKRNIKSLKQIRRFNFKLQKDYLSKNHFPIFIMTDQEGGSVSRIKHKFTPPSALSIGQTNLPIFAKDYGLITGKIMGLLGSNFNLAPVADLSNPYKKNFIGNRSFGNDPKKVLNFAQQFSQGLLDTSVIPTFKHYPGHGGTINDSHRKLPKKLASYDELKDTHFYPFKKIAELQIPSAIKTAHISFPNIDYSGVPATYSKKLITDILRVKFGYKGLVITDDLRMAGASVNSAEHVGIRALAAINAGCDMLMLAWGYKKQDFAKRFLIKSVKNNTLDVTRIDESLRRILRFKYKYSMNIKSHLSTNKKLRTAFKELKLFSNEISLKNFKASVKKQNMNRFKKPNSGYFNEIKSVSVFSAYRDFYKHLKLNSNYNYDFYQLTPKKTVSIESILKNDPKRLGGFYVTGIGTSKILNKLDIKTKKKILIVNTTYPGIIDLPSQYLDVININTTNHLSGKWTGKRIHNGNRFPATEH